MAEQIFMKGNEAVAEAAVRAGCRYYFGYPITPQSEIPEYLSRRMPEVNGYFVQAESEVASISMVFGAAGAGGRAMTSSSGIGISLMQEGISNLAGSQIPAVIVNMVRSGPGGANIQAAQGDYLQTVKGGGNGDYKLLVLAPNSVQELADFTFLAFDLADKYRNPVMILGDGVIAQMMEPVELPEFKTDLPAKPWAANGDLANRPRNQIHSVYAKPIDQENHVLLLQKKYDAMRAEEIRWEGTQTADAELILVAYGISSRICETVVEMARAEGLKVGLFRPITVSPFPYEQLRKLAGTAKHFLAVEMSAGQLVEDVMLGVCGAANVGHFGRMGGIIPTPQEILDKITGIMQGNGVKK